MVACTVLPLNLQFKAWDKLVHTLDDAKVVDFLRFMCPTGYEGLVPTPGTSNHSLAANHARVLTPR